jgi:hypothetical protein
MKRPNDGSGRSEAAMQGVGLRWQAQPGSNRRPQRQTQGGDFTVMKSILVSMSLPFAFDTLNVTEYVPGLS